MSVCTFDNPATYQRECWQDGVLLCIYSHELLYAPGLIPARHFFFGANVGPWKVGQLWGSRDAMTTPVTAPPIEGTVTDPSPAAASQLATGEPESRNTEGEGREG